MTVGEALATIGGVVVSFAVVLWIVVAVAVDDYRSFQPRHKVMTAIATILSGASLILFILGIIFSIE